MIKEKMMSIPVIDSGNIKNVQDIFPLIKRSAEWWVDGTITDEEFVKGLGYLVKQEIIRVY